MGESSNVMSLGGSIQQPKGGFNPEIPKILPHEKVFSIQVGNTMYRLSGASLSSDAPSYFTNFFMPYKDVDEQERPTLYLDRSSVVFDKIFHHLQGYYVIPEDETTFIWLYLDARYYNLPRLMKQLSESEVFIRIGERQFRVPRDIFSHPGDHPNFFTHGFQAFFGHGSENEFTRNLLRPPPIAPPTVTNRSGDLFEQLLNLLRGQHVEVSSEEHRRALLRECKYYRFKGLEQRLIPYQVVWTALEGSDHEAMHEEAIINLIDIRVKEITKGEVQNHVYYKRPYIDEPLRRLVIQIKDTTVRLIREPVIQKIFTVPPDTLVAKLENVMKRVSEVFNLPYSLQTKLDNAHLIVDSHDIDPLNFDDFLNAHGKRTRSPELYLSSSQWRIVIIEGTVQLELLKGVGYSSAKSRNKCREFM
ncbi:hypothetical protein TRICI_000782 [Trichomonascus ciferrii]|uniref:Potassium channel tetramerisation-type BTB domain-containing protein n=1 Tax=Trichomonascus ciferrii TaxID=44093 RepID=A0A642VAG7_9ASCO|nr:hypothetical protein TRICI_000782 [Trichomonascus ciferrii]